MQDIVVRRLKKRTSVSTRNGNAQRNTIRSHCLFYYRTTRIKWSQKRRPGGMLCVRTVIAAGARYVAVPPRRCFLRSHEWREVTFVKSKVSHIRACYPAQIHVVRKARCPPYYVARVYSSKIGGHIDADSNERRSRRRSTTSQKMMRSNQRQMGSRRGAPIHVECNQSILYINILGSYNVE